MAGLLRQNGSRAVVRNSKSGVQSTIENLNNGNRADQNEGALFVNFSKVGGAAHLSNAPSEQCNPKSLQVS